MTCKECKTLIEENGVHKHITSVGEAEFYHALCAPIPTQPTFKKDDKQKEFRPELTSALFERELARLNAKGAVKYSANNWRLGADYSRYIGAMLRHITDWRLGEKVDADTGVHPLICAAWSCMVLHEMELLHFGNDDRMGKVENDK